MGKHDGRESLEQEPASEPPEKDNREDGSQRDRHRKSRRSRHHTSSDEDDSSSSSDSGDERRRSRSKKRRRNRSSHRRSRRGSSESESEEESLSGSESESESDSEVERRERRRRREKEERRRKEKDRERRKRKKEKEERRKKDKKRKKKEKDTGKTGAVTNSWGKYGILRETDMWNKRPEFTAWLAEVKQVNLESLANWEEKQMFKEFMEDHNTATFPSKKYYDLEAYHRRQMEKEMKKGLKKIPVERTVFDDEEQRRVEMMKERERQKEAEVEALKRSMQTGMAQAMKEQARLREEMMYQYRLGNFEAAAAIQKRLDPDAPM